MPIIFLSARDSDFDIVAGLRLGADDYLTKDASLPHLVARIAALFRRSDLAAVGRRRRGRAQQRGALTLDLKRLTAHWNGQRVDLTLTEFWMVHALARHPGARQGSRQPDARRAASSSTTARSPRTSSGSAASSRRSIPAFDRIVTVYGIGYRWDAAAA